MTEQPTFAAEAQAIGEAGLASSPYAHLDVTPTRVAGVEQQCHVLGGPRVRLLPHHPAQGPAGGHRDAPTGRALSVPAQCGGLDVSGAGAGAGLGAAAVGWPWVGSRVWSWEAWRALLDEQCPGLGSRLCERLWDAAAVGYYRSQQAVPVVETLVCDDAPQFKGDHRRPEPVLGARRAALQETQSGGGRPPAGPGDLPGPLLGLLPGPAGVPGRIPPPAEHARLDAAFDALFATTTGYGALDDRIAKTAAKKQALLRVLDKPYLPLTNNPAELGARRRVRKRDVSFGARSPTGVAAWDVFHTVIGTAQLLGVNVLHYLQDRFSGAMRLPALADLIRQQSAAPLAAPRPLCRLTPAYWAGTLGVIKPRHDVGYTIRSYP